MLNIKYSLDGTGTRVVFKMTDNIYASPENSIYTQPGGTPEGGSLTTLCFRHALEDGTYERCMLQIYHVNRSDAFYRISRGNDTYYVKQGE